MKTLFLVIMASLLLLGCMGQQQSSRLPESAGSLKDRVSVLFWDSTYPLVVTTYQVTAKGSVFSIRNDGNDEVVVKRIISNSSEENALPSDTLLPSNGTREYRVGSITCGNASGKFSIEGFNIEFQYKNGTVSRLSRDGSPPLVGICLND